MIPTRLNQRFNRGTVAGFKKETGEIILVADRAVCVADYSFSEFEQIQLDTLQQYPAGYKWPSVAEIKKLDRRTIEFCGKLKQKFLGTQLLTNRILWLVTRDHIVNNQYASFFMYYLHLESNNLKEFYDTFYEGENNGWLCPIALIKVD